MVSERKNNRWKKVKRKKVTRRDPIQHASIPLKMFHSFCFQCFAKQGKHFKPMHIHSFNFFSFCLFAFVSKRSLACARVKCLARCVSFLFFKKRWIVIRNGPKKGSSLSETILLMRIILGYWFLKVCLWNLNLVSLWDY